MPIISSIRELQSVERAIQTNLLDFSLTLQQGTIQGAYGTFMGGQDRVFKVKMKVSQAAQEYWNVFIRQPSANYGYDERNITLSQWADLYREPIPPNSWLQQLGFRLGQDSIFFNDCDLVRTTHHRDGSQGRYEYLEVEFLCYEISAPQHVLSFAGRPTLDFDGRSVFVSPTPTIPTEVQEIAPAIPQTIRTTGSSGPFTVTFTGSPEITAPQQRDTVPGPVPAFNSPRWVATQQPVYTRVAEIPFSRAPTAPATPAPRNPEREAVTDFWEAFHGQARILNEESSVAPLRSGHDRFYSHRISNREFMNISSFEELWDLYQVRERDIFSYQPSYQPIPRFTRKDVARAYNFFVLAINNLASDEFVIDPIRFRSLLEPPTTDTSLIGSTTGVRAGLQQLNISRLNEALRDTVRGIHTRASSVRIESDEQAQRYFGCQKSSLNRTLKKAFKFIKTYFPNNVYSGMTDVQTESVIQFVQSLPGPRIPPNFIGDTVSRLIHPNPTIHNVDGSITLDFIWAEHINLATFFSFVPRFTPKLSPVQVNRVGRVSREQATRRRIENAVRARGTTIPERSDGSIIMTSNNIENYIRNAIDTHPDVGARSIQNALSILGSNYAVGALIKIIKYANKTRDNWVGTNRFVNWNRGRYESSDATHAAEFRIPRTTIETLLRIGNQGNRRNRSNFRQELTTKLEQLNALAACFGCTIRTSLVQLTPETSAQMPTNPGTDTVISEIRTFRVENFPIISDATYIPGISPLLPRTPLEITPMPGFFQEDSLGSVLRNTLAEHMMAVVALEAELFVERESNNEPYDEFSESEPQNISEMTRQQSMREVGPTISNVEFSYNVDYDDRRSGTTPVDNYDNHPASPPTPARYVGIEASARNVPRTSLTPAEYALYNSAQTAEVARRITQDNSVPLEPQGFAAGELGILASGRSRGQSNIGISSQLEQARAEALRDAAVTSARRETLVNSTLQGTERNQGANTNRESSFTQAARARAVREPAQTRATSEIATWLMNSVGYGAPAGRTTSLSGNMHASPIQPATADMMFESRVMSNTVRNEEPAMTTIRSRTDGSTISITPDQPPSSINSATVARNVHLDQIQTELRELREQTEQMLEQVAEIRPF